MCIKIGLPICTDLSSLHYTHQTAIHIHLPTLSPTLPSSGSTGLFSQLMLDHLHIPLLPDPSEDTYYITHRFTPDTPDNQSPFITNTSFPHTHTHYAYYTHTLILLSFSEGLFCSSPPSSLHPSAYSHSILELTHPHTWYRD